ncbi:MAG TPA: hypothetical protein VHC97_00485 [Thermoanaerobaculia bacterium]|jgi:hypothetical protein|nr:hypothetical protein [Thermoanaerobaculia bacterium]
MRSSRNVMLGAALSALAIAGALWAESARPSLPVIKKDRTAHPRGVAQKNVAQQNLSQVIIDNIDEYTSATQEQIYHAKIQDPQVPWQEKCQLAIQHRRLALLSSDLGGSLGGTIEHGSSTLRIRVLCPEEATVFEIPATFEVHTAPHPEEVQEMSFDTEMHAIEGSATDTGVFSSFHLVGGTGNGYPSPGHTSLIPAGDGNFAIDSTFNIGYRIEFVGAQGGPLEGASGKIESSIVMKAVNK